MLVLYAIKSHPYLVHALLDRNNDSVHVYMYTNIKSTFNYNIYIKLDQKEHNNKK